VKQARLQHNRSTELIKSINIVLRDQVSFARHNDRPPLIYVKADGGNVAQ